MTSYADGLFGLDGKWAVVTGGTRGIGLMIARGLLRAGATVMIASRKPDACEQAQAELAGEGGPVHAVAVDLSTPSGCDALADEIGRRTDALHLLVNNAGASWGAPLEQFPAHAWDKVLDLNLKAPFLLTRALLPGWRRPRRSTIRRGSSTSDRSTAFACRSTRTTPTRPARPHCIT